MVSKFGIFWAAILSGLVPAGACAMSSAGQAQPHCRVVAGEKLPASSGGAEAICAAIEAAVAAEAPNARFTAEVKVLKPWMLATSLVVNGKALPEQKFAVTDRELTRSSIKRFATSIAAKIAEASKA